jgi:hypothetical protein
MKVYHQTGFRYNWNIESFGDDIGDGLIFSPVNIDAKKLEKEISIDIKKESFFDPQIYLPKNPKSQLYTYPYFPTNIKSEFETQDFDAEKYKIAQQCMEFQLNNEFEYIVIPSRYTESIPHTDYIKSISNDFIIPFLETYKQSKKDKKVLVTLIMNESFIKNDSYRNEILSWVTSQDLNGVYLIFDYNSDSKQIKDAIFLSNAMQFINELKENEFEVHIGYNNTEGLLYSLANPNSISVGSYENLRNFQIRRFQENEGGKPPSPRLYSSELLQWIEFRYIETLPGLFPNWKNLFMPSEKYLDIIFKYLNEDYDKKSQPHFQKKEPYMYYFEVFYKQIKDLPDDITKRIDWVCNLCNKAIEEYKNITNAKIRLDDNSDGSHLPHWQNAITLYLKAKGG